MFEKEAEEYTENPKSAWKRGMTCVGSVRQAFKDGAEFGYNKAFVEADKNLKAVVADFNKANEWHYVKDGEYPKDKSKVLCIISELEDSYCEIGYYSQVETQTHKWIFEDYVMKDKSKEEWGVIAWKEIVLPKESE